MCTFHTVLRIAANAGYESGCGSAVVAAVVVEQMPADDAVMRRIAADAAELRMLTVAAAVGSSNCPFVRWDRCTSEQRSWQMDWQHLELQNSLGAASHHPYHRHP